MMNSKLQKSYGCWTSSISPQAVTNATTKRAECKVFDDTLYWLESISDEKGRMSLVKHTNEGTINLIPAPYNIRSKVQEYGGNSYCLTTSHIYFVNSDDQQIYRTFRDDPSAMPKPVTQSSNTRFAELTWHASTDRLIAVAEIHTDDKVENVLVTINGQTNMPADGEPNPATTLDVLHCGADFYAYPSLSLDGSTLCWMSWMHPNMPWDNTQLHIAEFKSPTSLHSTRVIDNGVESSKLQPRWGDDNTLYFIDDRSDWWNIRQLSAHDLERKNPKSKSVHDKEAELATPLWTLGMSNYAVISSDKIIASYTQNGRWSLCEIDINTGIDTLIESGFSAIESFNSGTNTSCFLASHPNSPPCIYRYKHESGTLENLTPSPAASADEISTPEAFSFPTGKNGNASAHAFFYPAHNSQFTAEGPPPVIALCHGGPTGQSHSGLDYKKQFWTNRGFAVVDINYRGSTGYGRKYRQSLYKQWGVYDVEDMVAAVDYLAAKNKIDANRVIIKGSSAGGYTVLAALCFSERFNAGVSLYGIGDLELLAKDTHKFEAHYLDQLIGPYPAEIDRYIERSPIHSTDKLSCPTLLFQGLEDKVVPPEQAREMASALDAQKIPFALVEYTEEGHGFRLDANIEHMLNAELHFYQRVFQLTTCKTDSDIHIAHL
ncbi:MAG: dipeptidyl aminopeptidase/acylaminoacyl peptidase [Flavobacteriales bacterium]|jgi:dipeptidyl aminopeptidase/acylaminoacyl peptidase